MDVFTTGWSIVFVIVQILFYHSQLFFLLLVYVSSHWIPAQLWRSWGSCRRHQGMSLEAIFWIGKIDGYFKVDHIGSNDIT